MMGLYVGLRHSLEDEIRKVHRQVAEHPEVTEPLDEVAEIDSPKSPGSVEEVDERLGDLFQRMRLFGCFRRTRRHGFLPVTISAGAG